MRTEDRVTLEEMLAARERRAENQRILIENFGKPVISFTLNTPGPVKVSARLEKCFDDGVALIEELFSLQGITILMSQIYKPKTGCEYYGVADCSAADAKLLLARAEEYAPLGRLYDMDVIDESGCPVSRSELGLPERRCLICGRPAHECSRSRRHSIEELTARMKEMIDTEENRENDSWKEVLYTSLICRGA